MGAGCFRHGHEAVLLEDYFYFFTLHGRIPRDTRCRQTVRLDSEVQRTPGLRLLRAPRNFAYCNSIALPRLWFCFVAYLPRVLADFFLEQVAQPGTRFVQLRLRIPNRTSHDSCNLVVFVPLHVVQNKNRTVAWWQLPDRALQVHAVHRSAQPQIRRSNILARPSTLFIRLGGLFQGGDRESFLPQTHEHDVDGHAMQPRRERRLPAKGADFSE